MKVDEARFWQRALAVSNAFRSGMNSESSSFHGVDALLVWTDKNPSSETQVDAEYTRSSMMSLHLLDGYEFPETMFLFTDKSLVIATSEKKVKMLEPCRGREPSDKLSLELLVKGKDPQGWPEVAQKVVEFVSKSHNGARVCSFVHKPQTGFGKALLDALSGAEVKVVPHGLGAMEEALVVRDKSSLLNIQEAVDKVCSVAEWFRKHIPELDEKPTSHETLVKKLNSMLVDEKKEIDTANVTSVQSGTALDSFAFTLSLENGGGPHASRSTSLDVIYVQAGANCKGYVAGYGRTLFIDPTDYQKAVYSALLTVRGELVKSLKPGAILSDIFKNAVQVLEAQKVMPREAFNQSSVGCSVGLGFGEEHLISETNMRKVEANSTFAICLHAEKLKMDPTKETDEKYFSCNLMDTVLVNESGCLLLTEHAKSEWKRVHFRFADEDEQQEKKANDDMDATTTRRTTRSQARSSENEEKEAQSKSRDVAMAERQWERIQKKQREGLRKAGNADADADDETSREKQDEQKGRLVRTYPSARDFPEYKRDKIHVDRMRECVLLPMGDRLIPFHMSTIKNVTKADEGAGAASIRFNFFFASDREQKELSPEMSAAVQQFPALPYIKELTFKSRDVQMVSKLVQSINDLKKKMRDQLKKESEEKDLVEQADLILLRERPKDKPAVLDGVSIFPTPSTRGQGRCQGKLRAHVNGFRFSADKVPPVDILYGNVKYFFFQRGEKQLKVLVHFFLKNPIVIGKRKTKHVQFFTEVQEGSSDLGGRGADRYDPDELEDEARQRKLVARLNKTFSQFCQQSLEIALINNYSIGDDNDVEVSNTPESQAAGFLGQPSKEMVFIEPTQHCLVHLVTEREFFVISVDEIEHIHLERVSPGRNKNFDIVFIRKAQCALDHSGDNLKVFRIEMVEMADFDKVRDWIDQHDELTYTCGTAAMNWDEIMKNVRYELDQGIFWKDTDGAEKKDIGWLFLDPSGADEDDEEDEDDEDSEFDGESDEEGGGESDDSSDDDDDSSMGSVVDDEDDEDDSGESVSEGEDWDELEKKAGEEDKLKKKRDMEKEKDRMHSKKHKQG